MTPRAIPDDERRVGALGEQRLVSPLCLNRSTGYWMKLLRVRRAGVLSRHRDPNAVHGLVLKGRWRCLEHDWIAEEGSLRVRAPGETHTLVVLDGVEPMITYSQVNGVMHYVDPWGEAVGYEDVFTKIDMCRKHFAEIGLGADFLNQFIRWTARWTPASAGAPLSRASLSALAFEIGGAHAPRKKTDCL